jgi:hypothetical protein
MAVFEAESASFLHDIRMRMAAGCLQTSLQQALGCFTMQVWGKLLHIEVCV